MNHFPTKTRQLLYTSHSSTTSMPNNPEKLGRLELAIRAVRTDQISSVRKAARLYDISFSTLQRRVYGI